MPRFKRILSYIFFILAVVFVVFFLLLEDKYVVPVVMYHNIAPTDVPQANTVTPESFARQMAYLKRHGYRVMKVDDLVQGIKMGKMFPHNSVVITFDDGYKDNYIYAFAVLKKYQFPAIVFVVSDLIGQEGYLNWDELKEMGRNGFTVGSHTRHHMYLPSLTSVMQIDQIRGSKRIIEEGLGLHVDYFSYPAGGFSEGIKSIVKNSDYKAAFTTNRGFDRFNKDVFELKRIRFNDDDSPLVLWAKLSGYYNLFRKVRQPSLEEGILTPERIIAGEK